MSCASFGNCWNLSHKVARPILPKPLKFLTNVMKKKAIVFVLSDFITDDYDNTLRIVGNKHDVTGIRVYDAKEESIPNLGMVQMLDAETGTLQLVNQGRKKSGTPMAAFHKEKVEYFMDSFTKSGCGVINCRVDESYVKKLLGYFKRRG